MAISCQLKAESQSSIRVFSMKHTHMLKKKQKNKGFILCKNKQDIITIRHRPFILEKANNIHSYLKFQVPKYLN